MDSLVIPLLKGSLDDCVTLGDDNGPSTSTAASTIQDKENKYKFVLKI